MADRTGVAGAADTDVAAGADTDAKTGAKSGAKSDAKAGAKSGAATPRERYRAQVRAEIKEHAWKQIAEAEGIRALPQRDREADGRERSRAVPLLRRP